MVLAVKARDLRCCGVRAGRAAVNYAAPDVEHNEHEARERAEASRAEEGFQRRCAFSGMESGTRILSPSGRQGNFESRCTGAR